MNRSDLLELHYIAPISNVPSILDKGILCYRAAQAIAHISVAMTEIQDRRSPKTVPGGMPLHEYVNLYIHARNPMLFKLRDQHQKLCVLRVSATVIDLPGAIIADGNAASEYTRFWPSPSGLAEVDRDLVFAEDWTDPDLIVYWRKKQVRCAEVLVPGRIEPRFILGGYVSCEEAKTELESLAPSLDVIIDEHLFFR